MTPLQLARLARLDRLDRLDRMDPYVNRKNADLDVQTNGGSGFEHKNGVFAFSKSMFSDAKQRDAIKVTSEAGTFVTALYTSTYD